jgi:hypothetical protein
MLFWWVHAWLAGERRLWLLGMAAAPVGAALAGVGPFRQLFEAFDPAWFERVLEHEPRLLFIMHWKVFDWARLAFDLVALYAAARLCEGRARGAFRAAQLAAVLAVATTFIGADLLHNVLITNLQPWRVLWIVHWLALAGLAVVVLRLWNEGEAGRLVTALLLFAFVTRGSPTSLAASLVALALFAAGARVVLRRSFTHLVLATIVAGALANWLVGEYRVLNNPAFIADAVRMPLAFSLAKPLPILLVAVAVVWLGLRRGAWRSAAVAAGLFLLVSVAVWDQRPAFARYVESAEPGQHPFSRIVAPGEQVWWESLPQGSSVVMSWFVMKRASYQSGTQHIGQHFSRDRTMELHRRDQLTLPFTFQSSLCGLMNQLEPSEKCEPDLEAVQDLCRDAPELDYVVLETDYPGKWVASWSPPVPVGGRVPLYHLYACKTLVSR